MAKVTLNERQRAGILLRMAAIVANDTPTRRRVDRLFDALKLDDLPRDATVRLNNPVAEWDERKLEYPTTSAHRDDLIEWLTPTQAAPLNGFMCRLLGPIYDGLIEGRDSNGADTAAAAAQQGETE